MHVYIPVFSTTASASEQTEGSAVSESSPTAALEGTEIKSVTGQILLTQQIHERGFAGNGSFDTVAGHQIQQQLDEKVDLHALTEAIANGSKISGTGESGKPKEYYKDLGSAKEELADTAGTRLRATHMFSTTDFFNYFTRLSDASTEDPIFRPWYTSGFPSESGSDPYDTGTRPPWGRFMNTVMPGGVLWVTDDNIPTFGTTSNSQIVVSAPAVSVVSLEGDPVLSVFVETVANELKVVLNLRSYVAAITRHASGTSSISGAGYVTSNK